MTDLVTALSATSSELIGDLGSFIVGLLDAIGGIFNGSSAPTDA